MHLRRKFAIQISNLIRRHTSTKPKISVELDETVSKDIKSETLKPRRHPGIISAKSIELPDKIKKAILTSLGDYPVKVVIRDGIKLSNYIKSRHTPPEEWQANEKRNEIFMKLLDKNADDMTPEEKQLQTKTKDKQLEKIVKERLYTWAAIDYNKYKGLQYLVNRAPPEYAVLKKLFEDITKRVPGYKPTTFFDFGSGVGTGVWAAREHWENSINEVYTVDASSDMNDLARIVLCDGEEDAEVPLKMFNQKQFLPASPTKYDIVLSAYSLFELPSAKHRLMTIQTLWKKTKDFLILVEYGSNAGYSIINEARDFILEYTDENMVGHVFSPCPHDKQCPRYLQDNTPCNFLITYRTLNFTDKIDLQDEKYSYVILRKGKRQPQKDDWPRIVRPTIVRSQHTICRLCTVDGNLNEVIFTAKKFNKQIYQCARASKWGDRLPITIASVCGKDTISSASDSSDVNTESELNLSQSNIESEKTEK